MALEGPELRKRILDTLDDNVSCLLFYDRKEDEDLPRGAIENAIVGGLVTIEELTERFAKELREACI